MEVSDAVLTLEHEASVKFAFAKPKLVAPIAVGFSQMWVTWMTFEERPRFTAIATVQYGTKPSALELTSNGTSTFFLNGNRTSFVHRVLLNNLKPNMDYCKLADHYTPGYFDHKQANL